MGGFKSLSCHLFKAKFESRVTLDSKIAYIERNIIYFNFYEYNFYKWHLFQLMYIAHSDTILAIYW